MAVEVPQLRAEDAEDAADAADARRRPKTPKTPEDAEDAEDARRRRRRPKTPKTPEDAEDAEDARRRRRRLKTPKTPEDEEDARRCRRVPNRSLETNSRFHLCRFTPTMSDQPQTCHFDLSWAMFYLPPSALQHNTFNIWSKLTCRVILLVIIIKFSPFSTQNTMFNIWTNLASWVMFEMSFPSPTTRQYVEQMKKVGIVSHDWNWTQPSNIYILAPTKHNVQHRSAWTSHLEPCLTGPFPTFANQYVEYMNKVEMSRHLYILDSCPSPEKQYLEHTKEWAFDIYNSVTLRCNTLNMWS